MTDRKHTTANLLTLAITLTLLSGLPLMAQDAPSADIANPDSPASDINPVLLSSEPVLGKQVTLAAMNLTAGGSTWFFFSLTPDQFVPIDANRTIMFDLDSYAAVGDFRAETDGVVIYAPTLPEIPQLLGVEISVQAANFPSKGAMELTNGLVWTMVL